MLLLRKSLRLTINTPEQWLCHINMFKTYQQHAEEAVNKNNPEKPSQMLCSTVLKDESTSQAATFVVEGMPKLDNSNILKKFQIEKLCHLNEAKQADMIQLVFQFVKLFPETPN